MSNKLDVFEAELSIGRNQEVFMSDIFLKIIESSIFVSFFIFAVIVIRLLFSKKVPKWIMCLLWSLIGIRLLVPITIESDFSVIPDFSLEYKNDEASSIEESTVLSLEIEAETSKDKQDDSVFVSDEESIGETENTSQGGILNVESGETPSSDGSYFESEGDGTNETKRILLPKSFLNVSSFLWSIGTIIMLLYGLIKYIVLKKRVSVFSAYKKGIRKCEEIDTPFVLGVIKPFIYLPFNLSEKTEKYIIAHEKAHIKRLDYISKIIAFVVLSIHWFNPLVWVAFSLFCKDIEYACDEKVLKTLDETEKKDYATALLECSIKGSRITACPVAFGEIGVKQRVKNAVSYKKPLLWIVIISIVICAVLPVVFLTSKKTRDNGGNTDNSIDNNDNSNSSEENVPVVDEVLDENLTMLRRARKSDFIRFGKYEQDDNASNGPEDIDWIVIEEEGTKLLVISMYSLERIPYNEEDVDVTWETCSVRKWLNEEFINVAFNDYERSLIPTVTIHDGNGIYDSLEENPTQDKVFLLSRAEANTYLRPHYGLACEATKSAAEKKGNEYDVKHPWWLRSASGDYNRVDTVDSDGTIWEKFEVPNNQYGCVRPSMWIDVSTLLKRPENDDNMNNEITREEVEKLSSAKVGDSVFFGKYEQDNVFANGREAIEWIVLASKDNQRLLVSKYALDCMQYSGYYPRYEYHQYTLVNWLDDEFYNSSFSHGEKELIVNTKRQISENKLKSTWFEDKIMLLSTQDCDKYLKGDDRFCEPTAYAASRGVKVCDNGKVDWWLCSAYGDRDFSVYVMNEEGSVKEKDMCSDDVGVRPAMWIDLER